MKSPLVSIYINAGTPGRLPGAFAFLAVGSIICDCIVNMKKICEGSFEDEISTGESREEVY